MGSVEGPTSLYPYFLTFTTKELKHHVWSHFLNIIYPCLDANQKVSSSKKDTITGSDFVSQEIHNEQREQRHYVPLLFMICESPPKAVQPNFKVDHLFAFKKIFFRSLTSQSTSLYRWEDEPL